MQRRAYWQVVYFSSSSVGKSALPLRSPAVCIWASSRSESLIRRGFGTLLFPAGQPSR
ncbi:hypothetical protein [Fischerella muscicola]|uniref:hypothetical protein n=1 Tax=Fischerella TaxID=1190 RepID=UPI0002ED5CA8|nr:hypothetical protein [Fischerella sp. FACHB-380]